MKYEQSEIRCGNCINWTLSGSHKEPCGDGYIDYDVGNCIILEKFTKQCQRCSCFAHKNEFIKNKKDGESLIE